MASAEGTFDIDSRDAEPYDETDGVNSLGRTSAGRQIIPTLDGMHTYFLDYEEL